MLLCLRVRQLAVIDELEVEFGPGLNVVTGETGAGKSILVNALKLVLGERGRPELVRSGAERAEVEALFSVSDPSRFGDFGARFGDFVDGDEILIRRVLDASGRTRATINGRLATASQLQGLASGLVDICSQHEHHSLVDPASHLSWLDAFSGLGPLRQEMRGAWEQLSGAATAVAEVEKLIRDRGEREDILRYQIAEIEKLSPEVGEEERLSEEIARLRHAAELSAGTSRAEDALYGGDDALCDRLSKIQGNIEDLCRFDPALEPIARQIEGALSELSDAAQQLGRYAGRIEGSPERLVELEERFHQLRRLSRKYGSVELVLKHLDTARGELSGISSAEERLEELKKEREKLLQRASLFARDLSAKRQAQAQRLGSAITGELSSLGMGDAKVVVDVARAEGKNGELVVDGARLGAEGLDRVEFLIATNRGEEPRPLRKVASGGELSRALLSLKRVLAGIAAEGLYVFDEVDSGVGGAVAEVIGRKLDEVARNHQVLCITHLPQIAAYGDQHFYVRKGVVGERTRSEITRLTEPERLEEIARMLGGIRITDTTRKAAKEMLKMAAAHGG